jgi:hypothetical protein
VIKINETTLHYTLCTKEYESKQLYTISGSLHGQCSDDKLMGFASTQFVTTTGVFIFSVTELAPVDNKG